jgi:uncharacterized protein (TIGR02186 family)
MDRLSLKGVIRSFWVGVLFWALFIPVVYGQSSPIGIDVIQPKTIRIGSFFSGEKVFVRAVVPSGAKVALRIIGPREDLVLMKKGRVGGLWMNVKQVPFRNIPKVYLLWTSEKMSALETRNPEKSMKLDYLSFLSGTLPDKDQKEGPLLINELIKLKEADNLYQVFEKTIRIKPLEKGEWDQADAVLELPAKIYPGVYALELIAFQEGKGTLLHSSTIEVRLAGFPALVSRVAHQKGLWYGILAVIIATISGLLIGIIFSSKGGH